jgi:hypothetical protein
MKKRFQNYYSSKTLFQNHFNLLIFQIIHFTIEIRLHFIEFDRIIPLFEFIVIFYQFLLDYIDNFRPFFRI